MKFLKLSLALSFMAVMSVTLNASPWQPFLKTAQQPKAGIAPVTVVDEDFSLFTAGSEAEPDATDLALNTFTVPDEYMHQPGWVGGGVHQAGGVCALKVHKSNGEDRDGFISTPLMELYGDVTMTYRAKRLENKEIIMDVVICDQWEGPMERHHRDTLTDEWKTFTYKTSAASFGRSNIQISTVGGEALIDDIKVVRVKNTIDVPYIQYPINNSLTEFTAWWMSVKDAKDYLLTVYYTELPEGALPQDSVLENFDGIKLNAEGTAIDETNPNYPEGWTIDIKKEGPQVATKEGDYHSAPLALVLGAEGDLIMSPEMPAEINGISFWVKPSSQENEGDYEDPLYSMFSVLVYRTDVKEWIRLANIPNFYIKNPEGEFYSFNVDAIGEYARQVKFEYIQDGNAHIDFMIDDIQLSYATQPQPKPMLDKIAVTDTVYTVSGIDPEKDYYCYVQARDGELVSEESRRMWVNGINGLKPEVLEATDITTNSFTAHWEAMPKAATYKVELAKRITAKEDMKEVVLLHEDFNAVKEGTVSAPKTTWGSPDLSDMGFTRTSWTFTQGMWAEGMVGSMGISWYGSAGLVVSPMLSLHNNGGKFTVKATVYNTYANDTIWVMLLKTINDTVALAGLYMPCGAPGLVSQTLEFPNGGQENVLVAFMSQYGMPFFVDEVTVTQDLKAGEKVQVPYFVERTNGDNAFMFKDLPENVDYAYAVTARRSRAFVDYASERSDEMVVLMQPTGVEDVLKAEGIVVVSLPDAIEVYAETAGLPIALYDMQGRLKRVAVTSVGATSISVNPGLYIVRVGQKTAKVMVK